MSAGDAMGAVAELAASQHGALTRAQAAALSFDRRRVATALRSGWLAEPLPGVLVTATSRPTWARRMCMATLASAGSAASHRAGARLHRLDGFRDDLVELIARRGLVPRPGVIAHRTTVLDATDLTVVAGIRVTSLVRTLADLGAVVSADRVKQALDDALRRGVALASIEEALDRLHRPGRSGTSVLAGVLGRPDRSQTVPDTWFERLVQRLAQGDALPPPVPQHPVRDAGGRLVARLDLAWPEAMLGLEAHSDRWHYGPRRGRRDRARDNQLAALGWELVYATWADVDDPTVLLQQLAMIHRRRSVLARRSG